jgi:hypothetical protein
MAKKQTKKPAKKKAVKKEEEFEDVPAKMSDIVDFEYLYGVKGTSRLHFLRGQARIKDHWLLQEWGKGPESVKPTHFNDIVPLGKVAVRMEEDDDGKINMLPLTEIFDNLFLKYGEKLPEGDLRWEMAPGYDKNKFYESVHDKYIKWYNQCIEMITGKFMLPDEKEEEGKIIQLDKD